MTFYKIIHTAITPDHIIFKIRVNDCVYSVYGILSSTEYTTTSDSRTFTPLYDSRTGAIVGFTD